MSLLEKAKSWFAPIKPLSREVLHYQTPPDADQQYRLHLRVEEDGRGLLVVNAATVLHLNQTATEYARLLIQGVGEEEVAARMARRYRVGRSQARDDYVRLRDHVLTLATTPDLCPVTFLGMERAEPFSAETSAPYRVDLALTYHVDESGTLDPEARRRVDRELTTDEWQRILRSLWDVGVPHVCFTGGEPTLRDDLVELVRYAEEQGLVTGLLTDGRQLREQGYLDELLLAGLDHLAIPHSNVGRGRDLIFALLPHFVLHPDLATFPIHDGLAGRRRTYLFVTPAGQQVSFFHHLAVFHLDGVVAGHVMFRQPHLHGNQANQPRLALAPDLYASRDVRDDGFPLGDASLEEFLHAR